MNNQLYIIDTDPLQDEALFAFYYGQVSPARRRKIDSFRRDRNRLLSLGAGILISHVLSAAGTDEDALAAGKYGKPYLPDADLFFNLSHAGTLAACAVSDAEVGLDIEKHRKFSEPLIRHILCEEERPLLDTGCEDPDIRLTQLWTVKESVMKYYGRGLSLLPTDIRICSADPLRVQCEYDGSSALSFTRYEVPGYEMTVCSAFESFTDDVQWFRLLKSSF